ncbi:LysR family transcriptional regulator [Iningainema tapete]|uniref:LysR family transcriptional regulator n=1 Tax=Iningainema tapete BLCC-T55 TaxID=2748662 RepID=A0A8J6XM67_9CYAN|nr:LysR family transcriptional regulator [Iningainema tapete]MBD2774274.1 LysR family transcriptional regulator [Iningainema tapete BLCC-T55]
MEFRQLQYFLAVAEELNFSRAAKKLKIAQPPLTRQIRKLEQELGVELFLRNNRRVEMTEAGKAFLEESRRTLEQVEHSMRVAQGASRGKIGRLVVAFEGSSAYDIVPASIKTYRERFPDVELVVLGMTTHEQVQALHAGAISVGFVVPPLKGKEKELVVEAVLQEPLVLALPENHPLASQSKVKVRSLANEPFIMAQRESGCGMYDQVMAICLRAGFSPKVTQEVNEMQVMLGFLAAGLGIALLSASVKQFQRPGVVYRELQPSCPEVALAVLWRRNDTSPVLHAFLDVVRELKSYNQQLTVNC